MNLQFVSSVMYFQYIFYDESPVAKWLPAPVVYLTIDTPLCNQ